jgi:hypothetical protein
MAQGQLLITVTVAGVLQEPEAEAPGRHLQREAFPAGQFPGIALAGVKGKGQALGQGGHEPGLLPGLFAPEAVVKMGHPQVQARIGLQAVQQV